MFGPRRQKTNDVSSTGVTDVEASVSFIEQFISEYGDDHVPFHSTSLVHALKETCFAPIESRKIIALYFHNGDDPFSKMFCPTLVKGETRTVLENTYYLLGWDVNDTLYHNALKKSMDENIDFELADCLLREKRAGLFTIFPVENSITVRDMLHCSTVKSSDVLAMLKNTEQKFRAEINNETELKILKDKVQSKNDINSTKFQQLIFDRLGDRDYDCFQYDEHEYLKQKIGFALYGPPSSKEGYDEKQNKSINKTFEKIRDCNNRYTEWQDEIFVSFIYNCLEPLPKEKLAKAIKNKDYNPNTDIVSIPIYVIRKCRGSANPCRIFIDSNNRRYNTWHHYINTNKLHKCTMVLPKQGRYLGDKDGNVFLEVHLSPPCGIAHTILTKIDIAGAVAGVASGGTTFLIAMIPAISVAPIALTAAVATGIVAGIYATARSANNLFDKFVHGEDLSFSNSEARGAYISIVAATLGFVGVGATTLVSHLAATGRNIGQGATMTVNILNVANLTTSGVGIGNSTYQIVDNWLKEQQKPSVLIIVQLSSSILFFGNAVYNFKTVGAVIKESQTNRLRDINDSLGSNRHRKTFNKITKETIRQNNGDAQAGRAEVISMISKVQNRDELLAILTRNNKLLNQQGVRFSANNGEVKLNGIPVDLSKFASLTKRQRTQFLIDLPPTAQPSPTNSNPNTTFMLDTIKMVFDTDHVSTLLKYGELISSGTSFIRLVATLLQDFPETIQEKILRIAKALMGELMDSIDNFFQVYFSDISKEPLGVIVHLVIGFLRSKVNSYEEEYQKARKLAKQSSDFDKDQFDKEWGVFKLKIGRRAIYWLEKSVDAFFKGKSVTETMLRELIEYVMTTITQMAIDYCDGEEKRKRREKYTKRNTVKITCAICGGYYFKNR